MRTFTFTGNTTEQNAKKFCSEDISLIENYEQAKADNFKGWCIHHRLEYLPCKNRWASRQELIDKGIYFNRPSWELVFMKFGEHHSFHRQDPNWKTKNTEAMRTSEKRKDAVAKARRKPLEIDGVRFESLRDAADHFGVCYVTVSAWINGKLKTSHVCRYPPKEGPDGTCETVTVGQNESNNQL